MNSRLVLILSLLLTLSIQLTLTQAAGHKQLAELVPRITTLKIMNSTDVEIIKILERLTESVLNNHNIRGFMQKLSEEGRQLYIVNHVISYNDLLRLKNGLQIDESRMDQLPTPELHILFTLNNASVLIAALIKTRPLPVSM